MALYIDYLAVMLLSLGVSAAYLAWFVYNLGKTGKTMPELVVPMFVLGFFNAISGFAMSFTWPLPAGYNMLFGDPLLFFGLILIAGAYMVRKNISVKNLALPGFLLGIYILVGAAAIVGYNLEPGSHFITSFGLYLVAGLAGLFAPVVYLNPKGSNRYIYYVLAALLILTAIAALFLAYTALYEHIGTFSAWFP